MLFLQCRPEGIVGKTAAGAAWCTVRTPRRRSRRNAGKRPPFRCGTLHHAVFLRGVLHVGSRTVAEAGARHAAASCGLGGVDLTVLPQGVHAGEAGRQGARFPSEAYAAGLGRGYAFGLSPSDVFPLVLSHEGKHLQHEIGNEGAEQILVSAGVEKGHVQHKDIHLHFLGENVPLLLDFLVVSSQTIDAGDAYLIAGFQASEHGPVLGPLEVLARYFVDEDVAFGNGTFLQGQTLAAFVLIDAGDADVSVGFSHEEILLFFLCRRRSRCCGTDGREER